MRWSQRVTFESVVFRDLAGSTAVFLSLRATDEFETDPVKSKQKTGRRDGRQASSMGLAGQS